MRLLRLLLIGRIMNWLNVFLKTCRGDVERLYRLSRSPTLVLFQPIYIESLHCMGRSFLKIPAWYGAELCHFCNPVDPGGRNCSRSPFNTKAPPFAPLSATTPTSFRQGSASKNGLMVTWPLKYCGVLGVFICILITSIAYLLSRFFPYFPTVNFCAFVWIYEFIHSCIIYFVPNKMTWPDGDRV